MDELQTEKSLVRTTFARVHDEFGYAASPEVPPYPSPDSTVLFVGAHISLWKPRLDAISRGAENPSYCSLDCIRLQNKNQFYGADPAVFNSVFKMHGAVSPADTFDKTVTAAEQFLGRLGIEDDRIVVKSNKELLRLFSTQKQVLVDTQPPNYYTWSYGDANLAGNGVTISIRNEQDGSPFDIGNIIAITKCETPSVVEWGFGEETLINAIHSDTVPIRYADMPTELRKGLTDNDHIKYVDALLTSLRIAGYGVEISERGAGAALHEYVRGCGYLAQKIGKTVVAALADVDAVAEHFGIPEAARLNVSDKMQYYIGRINYLQKCLSNKNRSLDQYVELGRQIGLSATLTQAVMEKE